MHRQVQVFSRWAVVAYSSLALCYPVKGKAQIEDTTHPVLAQADTATLPASSGRHRVGDTLVSYLKTPLAPKSLSWKAIVIPTALIGYGTLSFTSEWAEDINIFGRRFATNNGDPDRKTHIDDYTQHMPAVAVVGLNIAGVRGRNNIIDATLLYGMSSGIAGGIVKPLKRFTDSRRPDNSDALSFPSGHTATAFVSAEFLRQEYKDVSPWIGAAGYSVAILTGYLRMYNNKHWFSDVVAGAGIGILSTRVSYWLYPKMKNFVLRKTSAGNTMILPVYSDGYIGFTASHRF